jgi:hypothetical protein
MKISKLLIATLAVFVFSIILGMVTCGGVFSWVYKVEPTTVWKPLNFPLMWAGVLFINFIFVLVYAFINKGIETDNKFKKGVLYGFIVYAVGYLPGIIETYTFMNVANVVIVYWTIWGLIAFPLKGIIVASIYE